MNLMSKITSLLFLISLNSVHAKTTHDHHSSSNPSCKTFVKTLTPLQGAWNRFGGGLYVLFAAFGINGVNATTLDLLSAYQDEQINPQAENFGLALVDGGVQSTLAQNVTDHLKLYAQATENYAIALNAGTDPQSALAIREAEIEALILAFISIPKIQPEQIRALVNEYAQNQLLAIQAYASDNFSAAIRARAIGQGNQLPFYVAERILK